MVKIPLILRIKKESHKKIASAQDLLVETLYQVFNDAVLHGGTALWRCYYGNRFSEDIDVYINKDDEKINTFFLELKKKGFFIEKKKISENSIYSNLKFNDTYVRFEALFKDIQGILKEYETISGNLLTVISLSPEEFLKEKVLTYQNRKKIRDLYDIFFILRYIEKNPEIKNILDDFLSKFEDPIDPMELRVIILEGMTPGINQMIDYIRRF